MVVKELTPCMDCGWDEFELDHFETHRYNEHEIAFGAKLVLCDYCETDFGSYQKSFFGFKDRQLDMMDFKFVREVHDKSLRKGYFCPTCNMTAPFLEFVALCRMKNAKGKRK